MKYYRMKYLNVFKIVFSADDMVPQNVYLVRDTEHCPKGGEAVVSKYIDGVYGRLATEISNISEPVDWLVVDSGSLFSVCFGSQKVFEKRFERALEVAFGRDVKINKYHCSVMGGAVSRDSIEDHISKVMGEPSDINYLNELKLGTSNTCFHLEMSDR